MHNLYKPLPPPPPPTPPPSSSKRICRPGDKEEMIIFNLVPTLIIGGSCPKYHFFVATKHVFHCKKNYVCRNKIFLSQQKIFLSQQKMFCHDKNTFVAIKASRDKCFHDQIMFVATKICLLQQKYVCHDKHTFVVTKDVFAATILHLWQLRPTIDTTLSAVRETMATCVVHPTSCCMLLVMTVTIYFIHPRGKFIPANPILNHDCPGSLSVQTWCSYSWTTIALVLSRCKHDVPIPEPPLPGFSLSANMMFLFLNHHCPGSACTHEVPLPETECTWFFLSINLMFHFQRSHALGSLWAQTWCSTSRDRMELFLSEHKHDVPFPDIGWNLFLLSANMLFHFRDPVHLVLSECKHDVPFPEIECTCVRNVGSCAKKPGCSLNGICFDVCSWWFQGLKYWKPPFTPKQSFSVFKQSFSTLTENFPLHPNYLFLSLLKSSFYTQTIFCLYRNTSLCTQTIFFYLK